MSKELDYSRELTKADDKIKNLIAVMIIRDVYWGYLFSKVTRKGMREFPALMGVGATKDGQLQLFFNPFLVNRIKDDVVLVKILEHEGLHILNKHLPRLFKILSIEVDDFRRQMKSSTWNLAADCAINQLIRDFPKKISFDFTDIPELRKETTGESIFPDLFSPPLPVEKHTEYYFYELLKQCKEIESPGSCPLKQAIDKRMNGHKSRGDPDYDHKSVDQNDSEEKQGVGGKNKQESKSKSGSDQSEDKESEVGKVVEKTDGGDEEKESDSRDKDQCNRCPLSGGQCIANLGEQSSSSRSHSEWAKQFGESVDPSSLERKLDGFSKQIIKESVKDFKKRPKSRGTLPAYLSELIDEALASPQLPYYQIIKKLVFGSRLSKRVRSFNKINKKRGFLIRDDEFIQDGNLEIPVICPFPGVTLDRTYKICILVDTSGSMSRNDILESLAACKYIMENDRYCILTVIENDTEIKEEYTIKKVSDIRMEVKGRGGTYLYPGLQRAKELNQDIVLAFTDGYCENILDHPKNHIPKRLVYIISNNGTDDHVRGTGYVVWVPPQ